MTKNEIDKFSEILSATKHVVYANYVEFYFPFHEWEFKLSVDSVSKTYRGKLFLLNKPANISEYNVHLDDSGRAPQPEACLGLDRNGYHDFTILIEKVSDWVNNAYLIYIGEKTPDHGYRHGNVAFFEEIVSKYGLTFTVESFDQMTHEQKYDLIKIAKKFNKHIDENTFLADIRKEITKC